MLNGCLVVVLMLFVFCDFGRLRLVPSLDGRFSSDVELLITFADDNLLMEKIFFKY